jgi:hypothetical protein
MVDHWLDVVASVDLREIFTYHCSRCRLLLPQRSRQKVCWRENMSRQILEHWTCNTQRGSFQHLCENQNFRFLKPELPILLGFQWRSNKRSSGRDPVWVDAPWLVLGSAGSHLEHL